MSNRRRIGRGPYASPYAGNAAPNLYGPGRRRPGPAMGRPGDLVDPADRGGGDRVQHICPECGGPLARNHGALIVVQLCPPCGGTGLLDDDQLSRYLRTQA